MPGGDFRTLLNNSGVLKEEHAKFYIGEMFSAIDELHKLGYIRSSPANPPHLLLRRPNLATRPSPPVQTEISSPRTSSLTGRVTLS